MARDTSVGFSFVLWSALGTLSYVALFFVLLALLIVDKTLFSVGGWSYLIVGVIAWLLGGYWEAKKVWF